MREQCKTIMLNVEATEVKQMMKKVQRLIRLLKEANSLADELASKNIILKFDVES